MINFKLKKIMAIVFIAVMATILNPLVIEACPGCNTALTGSIGRGFNMSILFLMAMPFFIVGSIVASLIFMHRANHNNNGSTSQEKIKDDKIEES